MAESEGYGGPEGYGSVTPYTDKIDELIEHLEALQPYIQHKPGCNRSVIVNWPRDGAPPDTCTCGLSAIRGDL